MPYGEYLALGEACTTRTMTGNVTCTAVHDPNPSVTNGSARDRPARQDLWQHDRNPFIDHPEWVGAFWP